jgi:hypothetical protein
MSSDLVAAQRRRAEIVGEINVLELEAQRLDQLIAELSKPAVDDGLPCLTCSDERSRWIRHWIGVGCGAQIHRAASGLPLTCCKLTIAKTRSTIAASL